MCHSNILELSNECTFLQIQLNDERVAGYHEVGQLGFHVEKFAEKIFTEIGQNVGKLVYIQRLCKVSFKKFNVCRFHGFHCMI